MFETQFSAVGTSARPSLLPRLVGNRARFCAGAYAVECTFSREPPGAFSGFCKDSRESASSGNAPGTHGTSSPNWTRCAFAASHEQRSRERRNLPLARRFCQSVVRPRIKIRALGTASSPRANQRKYLHRTSPQQRVSWLSAGGAFTCSLGDFNGGEPPNSAAAPDRVPFAGPAPAAPRFSATRCVAL